MHHNHLWHNHCEVDRVDQSELATAVDKMILEQGYNDCQSACLEFPGPSVVL
jgi:hypothetical protein